MTDQVSKYRIQIRDPFGQPVVSFEWMSFDTECEPMNWFSQILDENNRAHAGFVNNDVNNRAIMYVTIEKNPGA